MPKASPKQLEDLAKLDARIERAKRELRRAERAEKRQAAAERRLDARRLIVMGRMMVAIAQRSDKERETVEKLIKQYISRDEEKWLFQMIDDEIQLDITKITN